MSTYSKKSLAPKITIGSLSSEAKALLSEIRADIARTTPGGTAAVEVATAISSMQEDPIRRKPVAAQNMYNDNVTYADHSPYSDGYADSYNDGRMRLNQGS